MTWSFQICALVSLPENCDTNSGWYDWSWSTETAAPSLLSVYLHVDPYFFLFVTHLRLLSVPNIHDAQRSTSFFRFKNLSKRTPSFSSLNVDLGCRQDNLLCHGLNYYWKVDSTYGNILISIFLVCDSWIYWWNPLRKIWIDAMSGTFLDWSNYLVDIFVFPWKNLML